jgi:hypothetical protein
VRRVALLLAVAAVLVSVGGAANAGTTTSWSRVTDLGARNIDQVGLARTNDGVLHAVWSRRVGTEEMVRHATIARNGGVGAPTTAVGGVRGLSDPDIVLMPDGSLRLFYGVIIPSPGGIRMSSAGPSGTGWTGGGKFSNDNTGGDPGATSDKSGTPIVAWSSGINSYYTIGTNHDVHLGPSPKCCFYDLEAAVDEANGEAFIAYHSNVTDAAGLFVSQIAPSLGAPQRAPNLLSGRNYLAPDHRMPLVARQGGGIYFAYCTGYPRCLQVRLWRVGGRAIVVATGRDIEDVNLSRGSGGRLWVMWQDSGRLRATRTNNAATKAGAIVNVPSPPGTSSMWDVFGEGSPGPLDLLAHVSARGGLATWHRQVLPGLTLKCSAKRTGATCRVTDAGAPVAGAKVRAGGKSASTSGGGTASLRLSSGRYAVTATKAGYSPASARVRVP